jgi:hypothetical protein
MNKVNLSLTRKENRRLSKSQKQLIDNLECSLIGRMISFE